MKNTVMKTSGSKIKQFDIFTYHRSMVEKNDKIQYETNKTIRKVSKFCHLINSIMWNKNTGSVKPQYKMCTLRRCYYVEWRHGHILREESKIQAVEMKFLRPIIGNTKSDRIRSACIREELRMGMGRTKFREID
jgi:hypothetical protein